MKYELDGLRDSAHNELSAASQPAELENVRVRYLGKKGLITEALGQIKDLSPEEKKAFGMRANELKRELEELILKRRAEVEAEQIEHAVRSAPMIDFTLPSAKTAGTLHPITIVAREIEEIFKSMGFMIEDGYEVETEFNNFEGVNIPKHHPARDMQDTFFLSNGELLKTHTSAAQNRCLQKYGAPLRVILPGRCFRNEATDAGHENTFFQCEGMMVDRDISISNLIYFMKVLLSEVFRRDVKVRMRPGFFPFVEPGFELDINCLICGGRGCSTCKQSGWVELLPCGMIHPNVLELGGVNSEEYTGFAFGLGLSRLTMMKYGIRDIRMLNSGDLRALGQFTQK